MELARERVIPRNLWLLHEMSVVAGLAALTALCARVAIPLPWTPVPATLQVAAVIFSGAAAGPWRGVFSQALYLLLGMMGLPVFAQPLSAGPSIMLDPTLGYLIAFPLASYLAGRWRSRFFGLAGAGLGLLAIYLVGGLWLFGWAAATGNTPSLAWTLWAGVLPFVPFDIAKAVVAVAGARPFVPGVTRAGRPPSGSDPE